MNESVSQRQPQRQQGHEQNHEQTTLVAARLRDLSVEDQGNLHTKALDESHHVDLQGKSIHSHKKKPVIHGRKASTYLRVFDDNDTDEHIDEHRLRSYSSGGLGAGSHQSGMVHRSNSYMKASVDQRPVLKNTLKPIDEPANVDSLALQPQTSASAIYLTDEDRNVLSSHNDISIIDEKDKTTMSMFEPEVVVPSIHIGAARNEKIPTEQKQPDPLTSTPAPAPAPAPEDLSPRTSTSPLMQDTNQQQQQQPDPNYKEHIYNEDNNGTLSRYQQKLPNESAIADEDDDIDERGDFPLAVELKPFKNKVGGHTAIFKFSERAVCKALVNAENNWYETIEREHKELLQFMPRYIGVLNVRQHFHTKEDFLQEINNEGGVDYKDAGNNSTVNTENTKKGNTNSNSKGDMTRTSSNRVLSPTLLGQKEDVYDDITPLPEVVLDDNKHIIPNSLYQQYSSSRSHSNSPSSAPIDSFLLSHSLDDDQVLKSDFNQGSGSTSVNTKLQELVLKEAFMKRKPSNSYQSCALDHRNRVGSSSSLKECKASRSSSSSSHNKMKTLGIQPYHRRNSTRHNITLTPNRGDNSAVDDYDDVMFKLDDEVHDSDIKSPEQEKGSFNHESVSLEETSHTIVSKFILLEDLTRKLKCPSVLDLKMGTRQYGVDAKRSKQLSQREKCKKTTSRKLGVRLCGLKIWDKKKKYYITRDKYFGRRVRVGWQFARVLARFLYDGETRRSIIKQIPLLIQQLDTLHSEIGKLKSYRLYGSSLLLFYDGDNPQNKRSRVKVNIIDFARCVTDHDIKNHLDTFKIAPHFPNREDQGFLRGVKSLKFYLLHIWKYLTNDNSIISEESLLAEYLDQNSEKFDTCWDWLDQFDSEDEADANNAQSPLRVKWRKYELIFDVEPRYVDEEISD